MKGAQVIVFLCAAVVIYADHCCFLPSTNTQVVAVPTKCGSGFGLNCEAVATFASPTSLLDWVGVQSIAFLIESNF